MALQAKMHLINSGQYILISKLRDKETFLHSRRYLMHKIESYRVCRMHEQNRMRSFFLMTRTQIAKKMCVKDIYYLHCLYFGPHLHIFSSAALQLNKARAFIAFIRNEAEYENGKVNLVFLNSNLYCSPFHRYIVKAYWIFSILNITRDKA